MMQALTHLGHKVSLLTRTASSPEALQGIEFHSVTQLGQSSSPKPPQLKWLERRYCSFWGVDEKLIAETSAVAERMQADVVVAVGLEVLPYLAGIRDAQRIWYAADEWVLHHLSQVSLTNRQSWNNVRDAAIKGVYEWAFAARVDRVWVVSRADARAVRWVMHRPSVDIVVNGVDSQHFAPVEATEVPDSCVFWGRLDFGPNIDALTWFARHVWPIVLRQRPSALFAVYGFQPTDEIRSLCAEHAFKLQSNLPDLRKEIARYQVVVLPFVSGAGVKNKLLEAAAMGRPILGSAKSFNGVELFNEQPCWTATSKTKWAQNLIALWENPGIRADLGCKARKWVKENYTWVAAARQAIAGITH